MTIFNLVIIVFTIITIIEDYFIPGDNIKLFFIKIIVAYFKFITEIYYFSFEYLVYIILILFNFTLNFLDYLSFI
jgi:hypothetical protein